MKKIIASTIVLVFVFIGLLAVFYPQTRLPKREGSLNLSGLKGEVKVTRDKWGIPHIEAQNEEDLHMALGFVMASDRLFQMDLLRRIANGQLSEVLGETTVEFDILLRKLRLRAHQNDFWKENRHLMDAKMVSLIEAFLAGIHQYIETQPLPIEFKILGYKPRPFTPQEAVAVSGYLALSFAEGIIADPLYTDLLNQFPKELVEKMYIREKNDKNIVTGQKTAAVRLKDQPWYGEFLKAQNFFRDGLGLFHGSNSWVVSGKRSASGFPLLANDPHVAFSNPAVWYEAHLKSPEFEIYGHFIPLVPFPAMGHDRQRGWAVTMSEVDDMDLYEERVNKLNQVQYKGKWVPLKIDKEIIKVRKAKDIEIEVRRTPHGPLINGTKYEVKGKNISLKWSYHHPKNDVATAIYKLSRSKELGDLDDALKHGATPGLNVSWVDRKGNIAWRVMGKIPLRRGFKGNQILEGWSGKHEYERYFKIKEHPGMVNPSDGVIVTANYRPQYNGPLPLEGYWQPGERFERIYDLLKKKEKWTLEEMKAIQNDQFVVTGKDMKDLLLSEVKVSGAREQRIIDKFKEWGGDSSKDSFGSALYHMWTHHLGKLALYDDLGETRFMAYNKVADFWNFFKTFFYEVDSPFWDDVKTLDKKETRSDIVTASFKKALARLEERLGPQEDQWTWGKIHTLEFEHPLGKVKPLNKIFNLGPYPVGGGYFQVDNMSTARYEDSFNVKLGASVRRLIDFADPEKSEGVLPTGNVGHFNSPFYKDQVELFINGKYRDQWLNLEDVKAHTHQVLTLRPL